MIIDYNSPVKDITMFGKPFNWGFLFWGKDRALSWYWGTKILSLILVSFKVGMILTRRNKYLSILSMFWISFSPGVQWWFMQHIGDLTFYTLAIFMALYYFFDGHHSKLMHVWLALILGSSLIGFALVLYPAVQVPLVYFLLTMVLAIYFKFRKSYKKSKFDMCLIVFTVFMVAIILYHFVRISYSDLKLVLNTAYPGKRISLGGGASIASLSYFITNWMLSFKDLNFADKIANWNNCEISGSYNFFPIVLIATPFIFKHEKKIDPIGIGLIVSGVGMLAWLFIKFPNFVAKLTLMSYVPTNRALYVFGFF